jgi:hypothetical protein
MCDESMKGIIVEMQAQHGKEMEDHTQRGGLPPVTVVSIGNKDLGRIISKAYEHCFAPERVLKIWAKIGAVPLTRNCLKNKKVRHEAGGAAPMALPLAALQVTHLANVNAARAAGLNAGVFAATVPVHSHIAREPTAAARVKALVQSGVINPSTMWQKTGTVAINGWQAISAHYGIAANDAKEAAAKALTKAEADLQVVTEAESLIATEVKDMSGKELVTATKLVYVAEPEQPVSRTFINGTKAGGIAFLNSLSLGRSWASLVAPTRIVCLAAQEAATAAVAAANAAALAAVVDHQPPVAPTIVSTGAVTAVDIDMGSMSETERRVLLANSS